MPTEQQHEVQRRSNLAILAQLRDTTDYPDWAVTVAYYSALHSLDRYLARSNVHPRSHVMRKAALAALVSVITQPVLNAYLDMENASRIARYDCVEMGPADVTEQLRRLDLIDRRLAQLP